MKRFLHKLALVFCGLLTVSVFAVPIVRGFFLYEDEKSAAIIALLILVLLVLMAVIGIRHRSKIEQRATAQTPGVIIHAGRWFGGDEYDTDVDWWFRIRYSVDRQEYRITRHMRFKCGSNAKQCVNRSVTVHYDPHHPKTAWVEFPWKNSK